MATEYQAVWDATGEKDYTLGLSKGMLYQFETGAYTNGVVFNGLTGLTETPGGAEANDTYADNIKYISIRSAETFGGTIESIGKPPAAFDQNDGKVRLNGVSAAQQRRKMFGFCFESKVGNDVDGPDAGIKLHFIYGATVSPSETANTTIGETPEPNANSWEFDTVPVNVGNIPGLGEVKPTAWVTLDSTDPDCDPAKLEALRTILYGDAATPTIAPTMPLPAEIFALMAP